MDYTKYNPLTLDHKAEPASIDEQEKYFSEVLGKETFEQLGDGPFSLNGLSLTRQEYFSLHPTCTLARPLQLYLLDRILNLKSAADQFPRGLCVFDFDFSIEYQTRVLGAKDRAASFQHIIKDYQKKLKQKPKVLLFLVDFQGRKFAAVVSRLWLEETEYSEEIKNFKETPSILILDPLQLVTHESEALLSRYAPLTQPHPEPRRPHERTHRVAQLSAEAANLPADPPQSQKRGRSRLDAHAPNRKVHF